MNISNRLYHLYLGRRMSQVWLQDSYCELRLHTRLSYFCETELRHSLTYNYMATAVGGNNIKKIKTV